MRSKNDSSRILSIAAWIWICYLLAMAMMDFMLYTPQAQQLFAQNAPNLAGQQPIPLLNEGSPRPPQNQRLTPIFLFYAANGIVALAFAAFTHWDWVRNRLGRAYYPLLLFVISAAPILINVLIVPRFP